MRLRGEDHAGVLAWCRDLEAKALATVPQSGYGGAGWTNTFGPWGWAQGTVPPGAKLDYAREAGDLWRNSVVAIVLGWLQDNFLSAIPEVFRPDKPGSMDGEAIDHDLIRLLEDPNPHWTADELWDAVLLSFKCDGNAYLIKARDGYGAPTQLWWAAPWQIWPRWPSEGNVFIGWYDYMVDSRIYPLKVSDVVHIRASPDPYNSRLGCARLKHIVRNVVGLNRGETYIASVIGNGGPKKVWVPDGPMQEIDDKEALGIKRRFMAVNGENAGDVVVANTPGHFENGSSGPQEMSLDSILDRPEATVCAALGVNPMVCALAVGAAMRSYANTKEADSQSWKNGQIPMQKRMARAITKQLLPDFPRSVGLKMRWNWSKVEALAEDATEAVTRGVAAYQGGISPLNESRGLAKLPPLPGKDDVWCGAQGSAPTNGDPQGEPAAPSHDVTEIADDTEDDDEEGEA
jgi:phage portal protein BeeE